MTSMHRDIGSSTFSDPTRALAARAGRLLCLAGAALGALGLLGWMADVPFLTTMVAGQPSMKPNTAVALIMLGLAAAALHREDHARVRRALSVLAAVVVLAASGLTLAEYVLAHSSQIDQVLLNLMGRSDLGPHPGRPSPPTALALALISIALLLFDVRPAARARPSEWLLLCALFIAFVALVGFAFGAGPLYRMAHKPVTGVAMPTAVSLLFICVGLLLERPHAGVMRVATSAGPGGIMLRQLAIPAVVAPIVLGPLVIQALELLRVHDFELLAATLAIVFTAVTLLLLAVTALPLDRAQEQLRLSQERLEMALRGADLATWDWNVQTGEVTFNPRWAEMRGWHLKDIRPHVDSWIAGVHPDDLPLARQALEDHFHGLTPEYACEHRIRTRSGEWLWILDRGKVFVRDKLGQPLRMAGTELDITPRKRLETQLRLALAQSAGILSISADAIICVDEQQHITMFNEGAEKIFGYTKAKVIGTPLDRLIPERYREIHRLHLKRFVTEEARARHMGGWKTEITGLRSTGEEFAADGTISKLDVGGRTVLTVALRDITERKRMEREERLLGEVASVLASTLDYETTLENVARLIARELADICVVEAVGEDGSGERSKVVPRDPGKAVAARVLQKVPPGGWQMLLASSVPGATRSVVFSQVNLERFEPLLAGDDHQAALRDIGPVSFVAVPLLGHGRLLGSLVLISTTGSRHYGANELYLTEQLASRAAWAVENARLYRTALSATQARDDLLGVVAHDLRNPLSSIVMQVSVLRRAAGQSQERSQESIEGIERAATRMSRLIDDLLDMTRIEAGGLRIDRGRVSVRQLVCDGLKALQPLAAAAAIELEQDVEQDIPDVLGDRDRLLQVLENLLSNAIKFTARGGHIVVGAEPEAEEVRFRVSDTGTGIPPEHLPYVFDRFWQARNTGRRGAGLGLAIVKGLVEAQGGRVWVESTLGRGSTFFFTIPVVPAMHTACA